MEHASDDPTDGFCTELLDFPDQQTIFSCLDTSLELEPVSPPDGELTEIPSIEFPDQQPSPSDLNPPPVIEPVSPTEGICPETVLLDFTSLSCLNPSSPGPVPSDKLPGPVLDFPASELPFPGARPCYLPRVPGPPM